MRYSLILITLIFVISCGNNEEDENTRSGGVSHFEVEPELENVVYEGAGTALSADQIVSNTG